FTVSYTGNIAVLTLTSVTGPGSKNQPSSSQAITATAKSPINKSKAPVLTSTARLVGISIAKPIASKPIMVAGLGHSNAIVAGGSGLRIWDHMPVIGTMAKPVAAAKVATEVNAPALHNNVAVSTGWMGESRAISPASKLGWMGTSSNRRVPVKAIPPTLPRLTR
ncbi:MAG: hypothetical protein WAL56_12215, partial [Candidatus Sulfotelmatobacter sp.]